MEGFFSGKYMAIAEFESSVEIGRPETVEPIVIFELPSVVSLGLETGVCGIEHPVWVVRDEEGEAVGLSNTSQGALEMIVGRSKAIRLDAAWRAFQELPTEKDGE